MPSALPRSWGGNAEVRMAIPVANVMALPKPCKTRNTINMVPLADSAQPNEDSAIMMLPYKKIFLRPSISAAFPKGTRKTADDSKKAMATQLMVMAFIENSLPICGKAMLTAAPRNGLMTEVRIMINSRVFLLNPAVCFFGCMWE